MKDGHVLMVIVAVALAMYLLTGCASVTPVYSPDGKIVKIEGHKFLADVAYEREWEELASDGKTVLKFKEKYSTETNADKIFSSAASLFGTLFNGASKVMP